MPCIDLLNRRWDETDETDEPSKQYFFFISCMLFNRWRQILFFGNRNPNPKPNPNLNPNPNGMFEI